MTTCPECGHRNAPGAQFCSSCQAFLDWDDDTRQQERTGPEERDGTAVTRTAPASPAPADHPDRSGSAASGPAGDASPGAEEAARPAAPRTPPVPTQPPVPPGPPARRAEAPAAAPRRPGDEVHVPGPRHHEDEQPVQPAPVPVQQARTTRTCPRCRASNPGDRRLCVACHAVLDTRAAQAPAARPLPWWRRLLGRDAEGRRMAAGSRPRRRRLPRPRIALPLALLLLAGAAWLFRSQLAGLFDFAKDSTGKPEALQVVEASASSSAAGHKPSAAFDKLSNRYWAPEEAGTFTGHWVRASFEKPVRLSKLLITPGTSAKQDEYLKQARPSHVTVVLHLASGEQDEKQLRLKDQAGDQSFDLRGSDVERVTVKVEDAYGARPGKRPAIAELEFFGRG